MNARTNASQEWEYTEVQVTNPASSIRRHRKKGWELVSAVAVPVPPVTHNKQRGSRKTWLPLVVVVTLILGVVFIFTLLGSGPRAQEITITELVQDVQAERVTLIVGYEDSNKLTVYYGDPSSRDTPVATLVKEPGVSILESLLEAGVPPEALRDLNITIEPASSLGNYLGIAGFCLPPILFTAVVAWVGWRFLSRQQQWSTLLIFRRPVRLDVDTEEAEVPRQEE